MSYARSARGLGQTLTPTIATLPTATPPSAEALAAARRRRAATYALGTGALLLGAAAGGIAGKRLAPKAPTLGMLAGGIAGTAASFGALAGYALMSMGH